MSDLVDVVMTGRQARDLLDALDRAAELPEGVVKLRRKLRQAQVDGWILVRVSEVDAARIARIASLAGLAGGDADSLLDALAENITTGRTPTRML